MSIEIVVLHPHEYFLEPLVLYITERLPQHVEHPRAVRIELDEGVAVQPVGAAGGGEVKPQTFRFHGTVGQLIVLQHTCISVYDGSPLKDQVHLSIEIRQTRVPRSWLRPLPNVMFSHCYKD